MRRGSSIGSALACLALLVAPSLAAMPLDDARAPPFSPSPPHRLGAIPAAYVPLVQGWLNGSAPDRAPPTDPAALLATMIPPTALPPPPAATQDWSVFFAAFGERPTAAEQRALAEFELAHPHVAQQVRALASDVARAQRLRTEAFAATTPADWALLPSAVALLASGRADELSIAQARAVATVDLVKLAQGADVLVRAASGAAEALRAAEARDARYQSSFPSTVLAPSTLESPSSLLSAVAGARPVDSGAGFAAGLEALQLAAGLPLDIGASALLPPDFDAPLGNILAAAARQAREPSPESGRATLATLGAELSPLVRAAVNLSLATPGHLDAASGAARPLLRVPAAQDAGGAVALLFEDQLGATGRPAQSGLAAGMAALADAQGAPFTDEDRARVATLEDALGPDLAARLGAVLAAQAAYDRDLAPGAPVPARAAEAWGAALPALDSDAPLATGDIMLLQDAVDAQRALRDLEGARAADLAQAIFDLASLPAPRSSESSVPLALPGVAGPVLFDNFGVLVADDADSTWDSASGRTLLLDLGGNDTYLMPVAGVSGGSTLGRTSVAVDLGGNDRYDSKHAYSLGAARGDTTPTFAMLVDASGDDAYAASAEPAMGWGYNGFGILADLKGDDRYRASGRGLGGANTTAGTSAAMGVVVDAYGNDEYAAATGLGSLEPNANSSATLAALVDLAGSDAYSKPCPVKLEHACFATPRSADPNPAQGAVAFVDGGGANAYPRPKADPTQESRPLIEPDGRRFVLAMDAGRYENETLTGVYEQCVSVANSCQSLPMPGPSPADVNGNGLPDFFENTRGRNFAPTPDNVLLDSDGDGWRDGVEWALGTDPASAASYPAGLPAPPSSIVDPTGLVPWPNGLQPRREGFLLNLPPVLAIGLPGKTTYEASYLLAIDLGTGADNADAHLGAAAANGFAVSLGGPTRYQPDGQALASVFPAKGASYHPDGVDLSGSDNAWSVTNAAGTFDEGSQDVTGAAGVAALIDLGGDDNYTAEEGSLAAATSSAGLAILLDAGGDDKYAAPGGKSMGFADAGGEAYFLDLGGDDAYVAPSQGVVESSMYAGGVGVFVDATGNDTYDAGPKVEIAQARYDDYQGQVREVGDNLGAVAGHPLAYAGPQAVAAFADLDGSDKYTVRDPASHVVVVITPKKEDRLRVSPTDDNAHGKAALFLDTRSGLGSGDRVDSDNDGTDDIVEEAGGTDPRSSGDRAHDTGNAGTFYVHLPRLGLVVGSGGDTTYAPGREYALLVDLGGRNEYKSRAGASSPRFGASLAVSLGSDETYDFRGGASLSSYSALAISHLPPDSAGFADAFYGGAQGAGVFGVGVLYTTSPLVVFRQHTHAQGIALGASQGAGILGVGALVLAPADRAASVTFESNVTAGAVARNQAQGAAVHGVGILANLRPDGADRYWLNVSAPDAASAGQGHAASGLGALVDLGGGNALAASGLAQASANGAGATAILALAGAGRDTLSSTTESQAFARGGAAVLHDAEGDDVLTLSGSPSLGQAAAIGGGTALLLDDRGNDERRAVAQAQAYAAGGSAAMLVDLTGSDAYVSNGPAQSTLGAGGGFAFLLDAAGADTYRVDPRTPAQGGVPADATGTGLALFVDAGGCDRYFSSPPSVASGTPILSVEPASPAHCTKGVAPGNDMDWNVLSGLAGHGVDAATLGGAHAAVFSNPAALTLVDLAVGSVVRGNVTLLVYANASAAGTRVQALPPDWVDRVEVFLDGALLGRAAPSGAAFAFPWKTLDAHGLPLVVDGAHALEAWVYPKSAAVDAQPFVRARSVVVDNPPIARAPMLPPAVSTKGGAVGIDLWVDRDRERGCGEVCAWAKQHFPPAEPEWNQTLTPDPGHATVVDSACPFCKARNLTAVLAGGDAYVWWEPQSDPQPIVGYRVFRNASGSLAPVGFVDARSTAFLANGTPTVADRNARFFLDREPPSGTTGYVVGTLRQTPLGYAMINATAQMDTAPRPGPATGLNATAVEGGVHLTWRPAKGATGYAVQAYPLAPYARSPQWCPVKNVTGTSFVDANLTKDEPYAYRVMPYAGAVPSSSCGNAYVVPLPAHAGAKATIPTRNVTAMAAPGEDVTIALRRVDDQSTRVPLAAFSAAGNQVNRLTLDAKGLRDGAYDLTTTLVDGYGAALGNATTSRVVLDGTPPVTTLLLPSFVGGPSALNGGLNLSFQATDGGGSGVDKTFVYAKLDDAAWPETPMEVDPALGSAIFTQVQDGSTVSVIAFSRDKVGHLEGATVPRAWTPEPRDAFADMLAAGKVAQAVVDVTPPHGSAQDAQRFARPGQRVAFSLALEEKGSGIASVALLVGKDSVPMTVKAGNHTATWTAAKPGLYQVMVLATDHAGNVGTIELGTVTVDAAAPVLGAISVSYGDGRAAGRPGDVARLRVAATDDLAPEGRLVVAADTTTVSSRATANLTYDRDARAYVGAFVLDQVRNASIRVRAADPAGNEATLVLPLAVDATLPALANVTIAPRADGFVVNWTTDAPTQGRVLYGKTPAAALSTAWDALSKTHGIVVSGLQPDTDYYARVESVTASGVSARSDIALVRTAKGLAVDVSPVSGFPVSSGASVVRVRVTDHQGNEVQDALVRATIRTPRGAEQVLATVKLGADGELRLPVQTYQDGEYGLEVAATSGSLAGNASVARFVIDRTPPAVLLKLPRAVVPGSVLRATVAESGSGVDLANASWTFAAGDGHEWRCPATLENETLSCRVPSLQGDRVRVRVGVPDRAGNLAAFDAHAPLARGPLALANATVRTADGFAHLRASTSAVLSVDVEGAPAESVWADLSRMGGSARVALREDEPGRFVARFQPSPGVADGAWPVPIEAVSMTGAVVTLRAIAVLDSTPPRAGSVSVYATTAAPSRADITLVSDEPTQAALALDAGRPVPPDETLAQQHTMRVEGLRPGERASGTARLVDAAGNVLVVPVAFLAAPDLQPPGEVRALAAEDDGDGRVRLSWAAATDDAGVERYRVERDATTLPDVATTWTRDVAPVGVPVTYRVRAIDVGGNEGPASAIIVTSTPVPRLSDGRVDPPQGGPGAYTYRVRLADAGDPQAQVSVIVDGQKRAMRSVGDGAFEAVVTLGPTTFDGEHRYSFRAESSRGNALFPAADDLLGPLVVAGAGPPGAAVAGAVLRVPDVGLASWLACVVAAGTIMLLFRRRRFA